MGIIILFTQEISSIAQYNKKIINNFHHCLCICFINAACIIVELHIILFTQEISS